MAITHLERRKIEAGVLIPMVQAFQRAIGKERANEIAREVIRGLARQDGSRWAAQFGQDLEAMRKVAALWAAGGGLELQAGTSRWPKASPAASPSSAPRPSCRAPRTATSAFLNEVPSAAAHRDRLAADVLAGIGGEE